MPGLQGGKALRMQYNPVFSEGILKAVRPVHISLALGDLQVAGTANLDTVPALFLSEKTGNIRQAQSFIKRESPSHPLRYAIERNRLQPLSWGSSALSLLAFLSDEEIEEVIRRAEPSPLDNRPLDSDVVRRQINTIKRDGYALSFGQRAPEAHGISVPFFDVQGEVYGNLTLTIPNFRYASHDQDKLIKRLLDSANALTTRLGWAATR